MSYRQMRLLLFFDLPSVTTYDRKAYRQFHKFLESEGFIMMQESVYSRLVLNTPSANSAITRIKQKSPKRGLIQIMKITEKQYSQIDYIIGCFYTQQIDNEDRLIII